MVVETCGDSARGDLHETSAFTTENEAWLSDAIQSRFGTKKCVVVTGAREPVVHSQLAKRHDLYSFEIRCDAEVRFDRLLQLGKVSSAKEFIEHELKEIALGTFEIMFAAPYTVPTNVSTDPDKIVRAIVKALQRAEATLN